MADKSEFPQGFHRAVFLRSDLPRNERHRADLTEGQAFYVPPTERNLRDVSTASIIDVLRRLLGSHVKVVGHNLKYDYVLLRRGQHVQQEAPDELARLEPHRLPAVGSVDAIVLPAERYRLAVGCNEAAV